ncbi:hypothetical protein KP509_18G023900 [Ceratopteris richardii]|uniref:Malectin-like domain-containing protein n=1 Tax=Ceratopteris richardii TaxID=49495 RepID=A0A8T2SQB5_CERRI|nr:hypothetical protein KP509_18G023900 [Ceratopteris richardii]
MASESISILLIVVSLQLMLLWPIGSSQSPGFTSIDCGSSYPSVYTDYEGIQWISDSNLISEGTSVHLSDNVLNQALATMRVFNGTQSKYCYSFTNSMNGYIVPKAFFLVRASIMPGTNPPYRPRNSDGMFRFKMIVDGDEWRDVQISYGDTTWWTFDVYVRAQRDRIDVCFSRDGPDGDAPFVSGLELRPLPPTLSSTIFMNGSGKILIGRGHSSYGVPSSGPSHVRYPNDTLDRYWISYRTSDSYLNSTERTINTLNVREHPPETILQTTFTVGPYFTLNWTGLEAGSEQYVQFYFAEINPLVNRSGIRVFSISANSRSLTTRLDVFGEVAANTAYSLPALVDADETRSILFVFTAVANSTFPPFLAAAEFFNTRLSNTLTSSATVDVIEATKNTLGLSNYTGDPCLPAGYGYNWLNCSEYNSEITAILLSNYQTGGKIPTELSQLTTLIQIFLDGNSLQGEIPDLSSLEKLSTLNLSNNNLSGSIPESLATLNNLKALYLQDNNLSGEIPSRLLQRKNASLLTFEFSGNPGLCESKSKCAASSPQSQSPDSNPKKSNIGLIVAIIVGCFILVLSTAAAGICLQWYCRRHASNLQNRSTKANEVSPVEQRHIQMQEVVNFNSFHQTKSKLLQITSV